jgi:hypothetical protein
MATTLDNNQLNYQQTGYLPAAGAWFQNPGLGYYPGPQVAGFNPMQQAGWGAMQGGAQMGQDFAKEMGGAFMGMLNNPYNVDPSQMPQVSYQNVSGLPQLQSQQIGPGMQVGAQQVGAQQIGQGPQVGYQQIGMGPQVQNQNVNTSGLMLGQGERANAQQVGAAPQVGAAGMDMFNNPYLKRSIQAGIDQNNENFNENVLTSLDADAIGAGMSGSSRAGIAQGLAANKLNKANLDMASQMNRDAYNTGMGNWLNQRGQDLGAQTTNASNWMQGNLANQAANLQAQGMNMNDALARQQANQGLGMQGQLANQQSNLQAQLANQSQYGDLSKANQAANLQAQLANQGQWGQNQRANQQYGLMGQMANQQYGLMGQMANQQNQLDIARLNQANNMMAQQGNQNTALSAGLQNAMGNMGAMNANAGNWLSAMQGNQGLQARMMGAMPGMMGQYSNAMMGPGAAMSAIGNQQQGHAQNQINAAMQQWNWMRDNPFNRLQGYSNIVQGAGMPTGGGAGGGGYNPWGDIGSMIGGINWGGMFGGGGGGYNLNDNGYAGPPVGLA